jgi:hypothetical protein
MLLILILNSLGVVIVWWLDLQLPVKSVPIAIKVVNSNPAFGEVYSIQFYVIIKLVSDLRQVGGFLWVLRFPLPKRTDRHDITEILLKVALSTITLIPKLNSFLRLAIFLFKNRNIISLIHNNYPILNLFENIFPIFPSVSQSF